MLLQIFKDKQIVRKMHYKLNTYYLQTSDEGKQQ